MTVSGALLYRPTMFLPVAAIPLTFKKHIRIKSNRGDVCKKAAQNFVQPFKFDAMYRSCILF